MIMTPSKILKFHEEYDNYFDINKDELNLILTLFKKDEKEGLKKMRILSCNIGYGLGMLDLKNILMKK